MKAAVLAVSSILSLLPLSTLLADGSAYQALRVVSAERGDDALKHVIEVTGEGGAPQPAAWRIVLDDPAARGGVREFQVAHGKIISEHTPINRYSGSSQGAIIELKKLNLDSSGAFTVAEKEAEKAHLGFDSVDYTLRTGDGALASPVWVIHLVDGSHHAVGSMSVAADNGEVVSSDLYAHHGAAPAYAGAPLPPPPHSGDHDNVYGSDTQPPGPSPADDNDDTTDTQGLRVGHRIKMGILSAGESLKNFFTGRDADH